ncbi:MAG: hypothetical protein JO276_04295 [Sphingomonadaceae bacterium]|nr:hypothetical protein [Sphingomonadaceae bacterium]
MDWKRRTWSAVALAGALSVLGVVIFTLLPESPPGPLRGGREARQAFLAELRSLRERAVRDARAAAAVGRFGFHGGSYEERLIEVRFPGFENCRIPGALSVGDLFGMDDRKEALRSVYGEAYNLEIVRIHPTALAENCAPPGRGERPARVLGVNETHFAQLSRQPNPPASIDYYVCSAQRRTGDGTIDVDRTVGPDGRFAAMRGQWSSRAPLSLSEDPRLQAFWSSDSDAPGWADAGLGLTWDIYPPLGPRGSKVSLSFRDPSGRPVAVRTRFAHSSERFVDILVDWAELKRAATPNGVYAVLRAPDGREARTWLIPAGLLDYVEQRLGEAVAAAATDAGDFQHRCRHVTGG